VPGVVDEKERKSNAPVTWSADLRPSVVALCCSRDCGATGKGGNRLGAKLWRRSRRTTTSHLLFMRRLLPAKAEIGRERCVCGYCLAGIRLGIMCAGAGCRRRDWLLAFGLERFV